MAVNSTTQLHWSPPPLQSLNFSSNCSLVADFFHSWFDIDLATLATNPNSNKTVSTNNATFWIPSSLGENATEAYFRNVLPPSLQLVPTIGDILDWEYQLRLEYAKTLETFYASNYTTSLDIPYFDFVIDQPARFCKNVTCDIGVETDQLADLNGPGMHIFIFFQAAVLSLYTLFVLLEGSYLLYCYKPDRRRRLHPPQHERKSLLRILYSSVRDAFDGFSDTIVVFNVALPIALIVHYFIGSGQKAAFRKDVILAAWFIACSFSSSLWVYRVGACLRRIQNKISNDSVEATHHIQKPHRRRGKVTLVSGVLVVISMLLIYSFVIYMMVRFESPGFGFEEYSDSICNFQYSLTESNLIHPLVILILYSLLRNSILGLIRWRIFQKKKDDSNHQHQHASKRGKLIRFYRDLDYSSRNHPTYRSWSNVLACLDMVVLSGGTWTLLCFYEKYRNQLLTILDQNWFKDGWDLGQVLSISAILPIGIDALRCLFKNWKLRKGQN